MKDQPGTDENRDLAAPDGSLQKNEYSSASAEEMHELSNVADLSPEEQMALYEESLKDSDWGHQPC